MQLLLKPTQIENEASQSLTQLYLQKGKPIQFYPRNLFLTAENSSFNPEKTFWFLDNWCQQQLLKFDMRHFKWNQSTIFNPQKVQRNSVSDIQNPYPSPKAFREGPCTYGDIVNACSSIASKTSRKRIFEVRVWP